MSIPSYILASSLGSILAQRLVRKLCVQCAVPASAEEQARLDKLDIDPSNAKVAQGCSDCFSTGFSGRTGVYSFLEFDDDIREAIRTDAGEFEIEDLARRNGFERLTEVAKSLIAAGTTSLAEIERVIGPLDPVHHGHAAHHDGSELHNNHDSGAPISKRKILLVEDDDNTRAILSMLLQNEFYEVAEAANGYEGLEQVFANPPALIICDLMMPKMNGLQMLQKLQADSRTKNIPVLMLTAADTEENEIQLLAGGASDFVTKGSDTRVLLARVQKLLEQHT